MASKYGKKQKSGTRDTAKYVTGVLTTLGQLQLLNTPTATWNLFVLYDRTAKLC